MSRANKMCLTTAMLSTLVVKRWEWDLTQPALIELIFLNISQTSLAHCPAYPTQPIIPHKLRSRI